MSWMRGFFDWAPDYSRRRAFDGEVVYSTSSDSALADKYRRAVHALQDIAALKPKPKTSGREIAIHALAMLGESRVDQRHDAEAETP